MKNRKKIKRIFTTVFLFLFISLFAINHNFIKAAKTQSAKKITIKIANKEVTGNTYFLEKGKSIDLKISALPKKLKKTISFQTNKKGVAAVNKNGKVTAKKQGNARITITVNSTNGKKKTAWVDIKVTKQEDTEKTAITLTVGDTVLEGYLNDSKPAKSLRDQLPITVTLSDSDNDFCGGDLSIDYNKSDVQYGYQNGDLAFWTPANNFVIFVDDEENSADIGDLVILGKITSSQKMLKELEGTIKVTIALKDSNTRILTEEQMPIEQPSISTEEQTTIELEIPIISEEEQIAMEPSILPADNESINGIETENKETGNKESEVSEMKLKIKVGEKELTASLEDNATTRAFIEKLPITLPMMDLYSREMCYRFTEELPTENFRTDRYEVGDLVYWAPGHSFVILYKQNGEQFSRQQLGHIDSGVEIFDGIGDVDVTFELEKE